MASLEKQRALHRTEKAKESSDIWEAVLAIDAAFTTAGLPALPSVHVRRAQSYLLRAGVINSGDLPDDALEEIANIGGSRAWTAEMGPIYENETVFTPDGTFYICTKPHTAQAGWEPGSEGGRTLFRIIRHEPDKPGEVLDFVWGEHVPYGTIRRDPIVDKYYTPIKEAGITLYEPHYPHLVPSEYTEVPAPNAEDDTEPTEPTEPVDPGEDIPDEPTPEPEHPRWADLDDGHTFAVGDYFTDYGKTYHVLRAFNKQVDYRPPALNGNFYEVV